MIPAPAAGRPYLPLSEFDFELPEHLIARRPVVPRDAARMLEVAGALHDRSVRDLPSLLDPGDLVVFNDTRVIEARLSGVRGADATRGEAHIEVTLHKALGPDSWLAFARPGKRLRQSDVIAFGPGFSACVAAKTGNGEIGLRFDRAGERLRAALAEFGAMPLPPYIAGKRAPDARDRSDYQTIFARAAGAVAAPTAGLHFTPELMAALAAHGIETAPLTLHVGAGTFLPVKTENVLDHRMHAEAGTIPAETARRVNEARARGNRVLAVGTTVLRLLESAAEAGGVREFSGETDIFITPGFRFRAVDLLLTNFHLPRSTLFILVCAFAGLARMRGAYAHAVARNYRFYSYGDCCLLHRAQDE